MKISRKLGKKAFYLQFILIIIFACMVVLSHILAFEINLQAWNSIMLASGSFMGIVWGSISTKNFKKTIALPIDDGNVKEGGN